MFRRGQRDRAKGHPILAALGLALMIGSFTWLQFSLEKVPSSKIGATPAATQEPFALVVIDPGHGGDDSGTIKAGILEKELTLDVAHRAERLLQLRGLTTVLTRADDSYISLTDRVAIANGRTNCIFVSIHFDEATRAAATGIETYYAAHQSSTKPANWLPFLQQTSLESTNLESQSLAAFIQEALVAHTQALNRGTRPEQFFVIANVRHPAVLVEGGFLTNKDEVVKLTNADYREQIAAAISDGVMHYRDVLQQQRTPLAVGLP